MKNFKLYVKTMLLGCLKSIKKTESKNSQDTKTNMNNIKLLSKSAVCIREKTKFIKKEVGDGGAAGGGGGQGDKNALPFDVF